MLPESFMLSISLLLWVHGARGSLAKPGCQERCGNITVPYPYGIGIGCFLHKSFEVSCNESFSYASPLRFVHNDQFPITEISMESIHIAGRVPVKCKDSATNAGAKRFQLDRHFRYSHTKNVYTAAGCNIFATFQSVSPSPIKAVGCPSFCTKAPAGGKVPFKSCNDSANTTSGTRFQLDSHFKYSHTKNVYVAAGCNIIASFLSLSPWHFRIARCASYCNAIPSFGSLTCNGSNGCCQSSIPGEINAFRAVVSNIQGPNPPCSHVFIAEKDYSIETTLFGYVETLYRFPVVLNWVITLTSCHEAQGRGSCLCGHNSQCIDSASKGRGHNCRCKNGYTGNPYLRTGCQDINECLSPSNYPCRKDQLCTNTPGSYKCTSTDGTSIELGIVASVIGIFALGAIGHWAYKELGRRKENKIKQKSFKRNGGYLLNQHISANKLNIMKIKVYAAKEIEKATNGFNQNRLLGKGGQGTVYKGFLADGTIVAIKRSNVVDEDEVERFVNEVFILAQINHRNIVKLLGCCLEYEFPLLVYEYLSNGTLSQHLHDGAEVSKFSWKDRIRVARDVAGALAYLHSYASPAILHRDIKPHNILLDENFRPVVSDFGLSRSVPLSRTHLTTKVEGTFGYLDPVYFHTGQLTEKSDVYAFGVVLTELLTRRKAVSSTNCGEGLVPFFQFLVKHNRVLEMLDKQVLNEALMDDILLVTKLAKTCINKNGKKRPSMKEVVLDLDKVKVVQLM